MRIILSLAIGISLALSSFSSFAGTPPVVGTAKLLWPSVPKACLPTVDRMSTNRSASCHCPPKELCDVMPPYIADVCCEVSTECTVNFVYDTTTKCPHYFTTGREEVEFCLMYEANLESVPPCVETCTTDKKGKETCVEDCTLHDEAIAENNKRKETKLELNTCLDSCVPKLDATRENAPETDQKMFSELRRNQGYPPNARDFQSFANCELQCRSTASTELATGGVNGDLVELLKVKATQMRVGKRGLNIATGRLLDFLNTVFPVWQKTPKQIRRSPEWRKKIAVRQEKIADFLYNNPPPIIPIENFDGKLSCATRDDLTICYGALLNNNSCSSCLAPETPILMANGDSTPITEIVAGDQIKTAYGKTAKVKEVVIIDWPILTLYSINKGELKLTSDHPILTSVGWRAVNYNQDIAKSVKKYGLQNVPKLKVGDMLITADGKLEVTSIEALSTTQNAKTYNLKLENGSSFYANGILVKDN